jgi:L-fuconolactonase
MHTRRQFLAQAAVATALTRMSEAADSIPIIDPHQHLWDFNDFRPPWLSGAPALNKSHTLQDYWTAAKGLNIVRTVYMEVDVDPVQQEMEADYVIRLSKRRSTKMAGGVIAGRPASTKFEAYARKYASQPAIKGVRQVIHVDSTPKGYCLQPEFVRSIQLLGELNLSFDICIRAAELPDAVKLVDQCPKTRFVLDHCGNADTQWTDRRQWEADMREIGKRQNVMGKVSGVIRTCKPGTDKARALEPYVRHTIECFGPDRVMFASDWPVCNLGGSLKEWVEAARLIVRDMPPADQRKLFHDNAERFYGLKKA